MHTRERITPVLRATARAMVVAAVVVSPWLFGCDPAWAWLGVCLVIAAASIVWGLSVLWDQAPRLNGGPAAVCLVLLGMLVALQVCALRGSLVNRISPLVGSIQAEAAALHQRLEGVGDAPAPGEPVAGWGTLSVAPGATWRSLMLWVAYVGTFLVLSNSLVSWRQVRLTAIVLVFGGFLLALVSILHHFSGSERLLWLRAPRHWSHIFGPFTNRNHFAAHMNMLVGVALGLLMAAVRPWSRLLLGRPREEGGPDSREVSLVALAGFAVLLMGGAVFISLSRGGMISLMTALGGFAVVAALKTRRPVFLAMTGVVVLLLCVGVLWLGARPVIERLASLADYLRNPRGDYRLVVMRDTLRLLGASPWFGWGFGAFRHIFPAFQSPGLEWRWLHAHNDWFQLLAEGGVVGAGLFLGAGAFLLLDLVRRMGRGSERASLFVLGLGVSLGTCALHSMMDYSLHKPANALLLAAVAGLAVAAVRIEHGALPSVAGEKPARGRAALRGVMGVAGGAVLGLLIMSEQHALRGELAMARFEVFAEAAGKARSGPARDRVIRAALDEAQAAMEGIADHADALQAISLMSFDWVRDRKVGRDLRVEALQLGRRAARRATEKAPSEYLAWVWLGRYYAVAGEIEQAEACLDRARALALARDQVRMFRGRRP